MRLELAGTHFAAGPVVTDELVKSKTNAYATTGQKKKDA
jgi:hypothetical protein